MERFPGCEYFTTKIHHLKIGNFVVERLLGFTDHSRMAESGQQRKEGRKRFKSEDGAGLCCIPNLSACKVGREAEEVQWQWLEMIRGARQIFCSRLSARTGDHTIPYYTILYHTHIITYHIISYHTIPYCRSYRGGRGHR